MRSPISCSRMPWHVRQSFPAPRAPSGRRRDGGAIDAMLLQSGGDETIRLHFLDEGGKAARGGFATRPGQAHRLLDDHESPVEQAVPLKPPGIRLELLLDAGCNFEPLFDVG